MRSRRRRQAHKFVGGGTRPVVLRTGVLHRTEFGAAPLIAFNDKRPSDIGTCPGWPSGDAALFEEVLKIGFFWYGPPEWQVGINENLAKLEQQDEREQVIARILEAYPPEILTEADKFYRLRKMPGDSYALGKFDSTDWGQSTARLLRPRQGRPADSTHPTFLSCTARRISRPVCMNAVSRSRMLSF